MINSALEGVVEAVREEPKLDYVRKTVGIYDGTKSRPVKASGSPAAHMLLACLRI